MDGPDVIEELAGSFSIRDLVRVDAGMEGAWGDTVRTVWTPRDGLSAAAIHLSHASLAPSVELMFRHFWLGLHCFVREGDQNVFDHDLARRIVGVIERRLAESHV
jgi:hypothetical protein